MAGLKVPTYERQTRFVSAYRGPTASPQTFGSDIGKGLTALGAGITDVGLAQMQRAAQRQEAVDLNKQQTFRLGLNDDVHRDVLDNKDAASVAEGNPTEDAQGRWKKMAEARLEGMLKSGDRPSRKAVEKMRRDAELIQAQWSETHLNMVDSGRRLNIANDANKNLQLIHASAAEHGQFGAQNAEQAEALATLQKLLPVDDYLRVEEQARIGMGKAVVQHLMRVQDQGLLAKDHQERERIKAEADALIDEASTLGYIEGAAVAETKRIWRAQFNERAAASMDANSRNAVLGGAPAVEDAGTYSYLFGKLADDKSQTHITGMRADFARGVAKLFQAAPPEIAAGLGIFSGTRTYQRQAELYSDFLAAKARGENPKPVAPPGSSQHNKGNAADLSWNGKRFDSAPPEVIKWVHENAAALGLSFPVPGEAWHIEGPRAGDGQGGGTTISRLAGVDVASLPAGMRNNNPGNIKFFSGADTTYSGVVGASVNTDQGDKQIVFRSPEAGMAAMAGLLLKKFNAGRTTVNQIIAAQGGWTPGNTQAAENVAKSMGIGVNDQINLADDAQLKSLMRSLMTQEHGDASGHYTDQMVLAGITSARTGQPPVESGDDFTGIYGPQGNSFDDMPADTRRKIIEGAQAEMARGTDALKSDINDYTAWLRAGNTPDGRYSIEELITRMGQPLGTEASEQIAAAAAYGKDAAALAMASPEQVQAIMAERAATLASPEGFIQHATDAAGLAQIVAARDKLIADDPGGYVADKDKDTRAASGKYYQRGATAAEQQAAAHAWAVASGKAQDLLGIRKDLQRILPDRVADDIAAQFSSKQPGGQNAAELMAGLEATWGKHWEQVFEQLAKDSKLPGTALVVGAMNRDSQNVARTLLAESALIGTEGLEKGVSPETSRDIKAGLHEATADFAATLANNGVSGANTYNTFNEATYQLALTYARTQGLNAQAALEKAKVDILDRAYTFMDTYRVPIEMNADAIDQRAAQYQANIDPTELMQPASLAGIHPDDVAAAYHTQVTANGYWVTSDNEDGLTLYDETGSAVRRTDGTPYTVKWKDLQVGATEDITYPGFGLVSGDEPTAPLTTAETSMEPGLVASAETAISDTNVTADVEGSPRQLDYAAPPASGAATVGGSGAPGGTTTEPQERTLGATEPKPREARAASARISQPQRRLLVQGMSLEQSSRMARTGGTPREVLIALTGSEKPTRAEVEAVIADLEAKIPGSGGNKEELLEMLRLAGRAIR